MQIALVVPGRLDTGSGGYYYDRRLVAHLRDRGHAVEVVSLATGSLARRLLANARPTPAAMVKSDLVIVDALAQPSVMRAVQRLDGPVVGLFHMGLRRAVRDATRPTRRLVGTIERRFLHCLDAAIFNSDDTRRAVGGRSHAIPTLVAPPGKDRFDRAPSAVVDVPRETADLAVLYLGNVIERKGLDLLVDALASVDLDWSLAIVGDDGVEPAFARRVRSRIRRHEVADRVRWTGRLGDDAVATHLDRADVLAVTSRYEPFGLVYLEAMGAGCVPAASAHGGAEAFVTDGVSGLVVPPESATIARRLEPLADRDRLTTLAAGARRAYDRQPTWVESLDRIGTFLEALAGEGDPTDGRFRTMRVDPIDR